MSKINKVYPAFFNGVSQQNPELILDSQCKEMVNCVPDIVSGIRKRPPVTVAGVKDFVTYPEMENASVFHAYDRGEDNEEYFMVNTTDPLDPVQVFNKAGEQQLVTYDATYKDNMLEYLNSGSLKGLTVQDRTWVYSKTTKTKVNSDSRLAPAADYDKVAYYWLKRGSGDRYNPFNYAVYLNGVTYACDPNKPSLDAKDPVTGFEDSDYAAADLAAKISSSVETKNSASVVLEPRASKTINITLGASLNNITVTSNKDNIVIADFTYDSVTGVVAVTVRNLAWFTGISGTITAKGLSDYGFYAEAQGSIIKIYRGDGEDFTFDCWDSWGNQASEGWKGSVNKLTDLPKEMPFDNVYVKIIGDETTTFTDYYVKWNGSSWIETVAPDEVRGNLENMPLIMDRISLGDSVGALGVTPDTSYSASFIDFYSQGGSYSYVVRRIYVDAVVTNDQIIAINEALFKDNLKIKVSYDDGATYVLQGASEITWGSAKIAFRSKTGVFTYTTYVTNNFLTKTDNVAVFRFQPEEWSVPIVGNLENNPDPSFAGKAIQDMFFYKNRLGLASEDSITLTETANYTNFYATTVLDIVDTDVIDLTIAANQASKIYYAKPFNDSLYIFTKYSQYELVAEGAFTPSTVSINNTSNYPMATNVEPVVVNDSLYFISTTGNNQQLREYIKTDKLSVQGVDLNVSTPTYIQKPIKKLIVDGVLGYVLCCTDTGTIYLYSYKEDGTDRIQSAWSRWELYENTSDHSNYEYFSVGGTVLIFYKEFVDGYYVYSNMMLDKTEGNVYHDISAEDVVHPYKAYVMLPDYYPQLTNVRTPLNKMLIKKVKVEGQGAFSGEVYRKDYNKTYTKSKDFSMKDLDMQIASKVGNVEITIYDDTTNDFKITSVVVEGLFNTTSREMR